MVPMRTYKPYAIRTALRRVRWLALNPFAATTLRARGRHAPCPCYLERYALRKHGALPRPPYGRAPRSFLRHETAPIDTAQAHWSDRNGPMLPAVAPSSLWQKS